MKKSKWIKFNKLDSKEKVYTVINILLALGFFIATITLMIIFLLNGDPNKRLFACIGTGLLYLLPFAYQLVFRRRLSNLVFAYFNVYLILAGFLGSVLNFYDLISWYDIVIHVLAGYTFAVLGLIIISRFGKYKNMNPWLVVLFCFCFTLAVELVWEMMEWFADLCLGQMAQGTPPEGFTAPLVTDTDLDMLCNLGGGIIFAVQFIIGKFTKIPTGIKAYERELCYLKEEKSSEENIKEEITETNKEETNRDGDDKDENQKA